MSVNNQKIQCSSIGREDYLSRKKSMLLSVGDYRNRFLAQDQNSINGKIIKLIL